MLLAILILTSSKSSSSAGWKFSHQDVPKLPFFDLEYFIQTSYLHVAHLGVARGKNGDIRKGQRPGQISLRGSVCVARGLGL